MNLPKGDARSLDAASRSDFTIGCKCSPITGHRDDCPQHPAFSAAKGRERELTDYERGYLEGLAAFAWFKDGTRYVGTTGTTFRDAAMTFLIPRGWPYDDAGRIAHHA